MLVDPSKELEGIYENVLVIQTAVIEALQPGKKLSEVYQVSKNFEKTLLLIGQSCQHVI